MIKLSLLILILGVTLVTPNAVFKNDESMHAVKKRQTTRNLIKADFVGNPKEQTPAFWNKAAQSTLNAKVNEKLNTNIAKNVILLIGDGMSLPTLAATRMYLKDENFELSFEKFDYTGISKTYCVDYQVPDSACTATAYLSGIKTNSGTLGVSAKVQFEDCSTYSPSEDAYSIMKFAQDKGKATGIVTTTRVTHATPAAAYANSPSRDWENSNNIMGTPCLDIATQLVKGDVGRKLNVVMGGGRKEFLSTCDGGNRFDKKNLLNHWLADRNQRGKGVILENRDDLMNLNTNNVDYVLGLFQGSHLSFMVDPARKNEPSLTEMTMKAIDVLEKKAGKNGYVLLIEGGLIDYGHHYNMAKVALEETAELHRTVEAIMKRVNTKETLVVLTSDHSHTMTINGYPKRGNDILGASGSTAWDIAMDNKPYFTLSYANGMSYYEHLDPSGERKNPVTMKRDDPFFMHPALVPLDSETHGGDDVAVFAAGPYSHIFSGVYEQNFIPHALKYASCLGDGLKAKGC